MTTDAPPPDDDDALPPGPDDEADPTERARARAFAELIDKVVAGRPPAAVPAEDQALLEVATAIRASVRPVELGASRRAAIVESALAAALDRKGGRASGASGALPVVPLASRRSRAARWVPWSIAGAATAAAAAALILWLGARGAPSTTPAPTTAIRLPAAERSRPADPLIGVIERDRAGAAVDRIDAIYADRLSGYRARTMAGGRR